ALLLVQEADSGEPINSIAPYRYVLERGAVRAAPNDSDISDVSEGLLMMGKTLQDMAADDYRDAVSAQQSKQLMRMLLNHHLAGKTLHTRELIRDLQKI
ncbi:MAG: DNA repair protein RecO, partial [Betaproteobacteria bacterium]|nr:DNA repair protein RecO [Betaproteobacteria bacterium]